MGESLKEDLSLLVDDRLEVSNARRVYHDMESDRAAAVREYREETGVEIERGPHVWDRELRFGFAGKVYDQSGHIVAGNPKVFEALVEARAPHVPNELQD